MQRCPAEPRKQGRVLPCSASNRCNDTTVWPCAARRPTGGHVKHLGNFCGQPQFWSPQFCIGAMLVSKVTTGIGALPAFIPSRAPIRAVRCQSVSDSSEQHQLTRRALSTGVAALATAALGVATSPAALAEPDLTITQKVYFDVSVDGEDAGRIVFGLCVFHGWLCIFLARSLSNSGFLCAWLVRAIGMVTRCRKLSRISSSFAPARQVSGTRGAVSTE